MSESYFDPAYGLKALKAARAVESFGPLRFGIDDRFWAYEEGVWSPANPLVHRRIVRLLGERYRPHHGQAVREVLRAELEQLEIAPVEAYINVYNGMVAWRTGELISHDQLYFSTVQLPVTFHPDAQCPQFDAFLAEAVAPDDIARVWEMIGYLMMSGNPLQRTFLLTGGGGNGKGVLLEVIKHLLGIAAIAAVPLHEFAISQFATAELFGKLANVCGDIDASFIESTARIKEITGEDTVKGERKFGQPFYFRPWCKMIFSANEIPAAADSSSGWTRRFEVINFPNRPLAPDPTLKDRLTSTQELRGVAAHGVAALRVLMGRRAFSHGAAALAAHEQFRVINNKVLEWIAETCDYPNPSKWYDRRELYKAYKRWDADYGGGRPLGSKRFYALLRQVEGMREVLHDGWHGFYGVRLKVDIAYGHVFRPEEPVEVENGSPLPENPADQLF